MNPVVYDHGTGKVQGLVRSPSLKSNSVRRGEYLEERSLSTIMAQGKFRDSFDPRSQTRSGEEST